MTSVVLISVLYGGVSEARLLIPNNCYNINIIYTVYKNETKLLWVGKEMPASLGLQWTQFSG